MRTSNLLVSASALILAAGGVASGCISNTVAPLDSIDAGLPALDSGALADGGVPGMDATIGAQGDGSAAATLTTTPIDFGLVGCGTGNASQTYSFTNTGSAPVTYSASVASGSVFSVTAGGSGVVTSGATGSITVAVSAIPTTTKAGAVLASTLHVTTNVPGFTGIDVPLKVTAQGGALTVTPALAGFGDVQIASSGTTIPLQITNSGNAPVTVTFGPPTEPDGGAVDPEFGVFYGGSPGPATIVANGTAGAGATFLPTSPGARSVALAILTNDPLCASPATAIAMSGTGTTAQVAIGPNPLQFGSVSCGQSGSPLQVTLTNTSRGAITFTDALGRGTASPFTIDVTSGTIPGNNGDAGTTVITVTPKPIPVPSSVAAGAFNDTLVVTPSAPFVAPTTISLEESASGAILAVTMGGDGGTDFGTLPSDQTGSLPFSVTNTGNVNAPLTVSAAGAGYSASFSTAASAAADGGVASGNVLFSPTTNGSSPGTLTVSTSVPVCSLSPGIALTGAGTLPLATFSSNPIGVGAICGGGATTQGSVTITNNGGSPLVISSVASASGAFTIVSSPKGAIAPGNNDVILVQAAAIGQGTPGGSALDDTLTFTTNESGNPTRSVPVSVAVSGANLAYVGAPGNTAAPCQSAVFYSVSNTGDMPATLIATGSYPDEGDNGNDGSLFVFGGAFSSPTLVAAGGQVGDTVGVSICSVSTKLPCPSTDTQPFTATGDPDAGTSVGICIPLPAMQLSFNHCTCTCQD